MNRSIGDEEGGQGCPPYLYKYLSPARITDVIQNRELRFTPLANTNDSFEIRSTFKRLIGPRFEYELERRLSEEFYKEAIALKLRKALDARSLQSISTDSAIELIKLHYGYDVYEYVNDSLKRVFNSYIPILNDPENVANIFWAMGEQLLCFSMSEFAGSPPMWAHYAANHQGFVVEFETGSDFFKNSHVPKKSRLHKVRYFDGQIDEPLSDPELVINSKTTDWAYEREWRMYETKEHVTRIAGGADNPIYLFEFPHAAVHRVIVGSAMSRDNIELIRSILADSYPSCELAIARPDRRTSTYIQTCI